MNRTIPFIALLCIVGILFVSPLCAEELGRPNVVVILVDDMGFSDIGCYGSEIPTPNLNALAADGLRFTQFYNTGRCCPTRAALLTGLYSHQAGIGHMTGDYGKPGYRGFLNDACVTLGDVARSAGYLSAMSGKWHVGSTEKSMQPMARGFDRFYGIPEGGGIYMQLKQGRTIQLNGETIASVDNPLPDGWYSTDAWTEYGLKFIDEALEAEKPFFLYVAHNAPHFPLQASAEDIAMFRGKYRKGWDKLSAERYARQVEMGLIHSDWEKSDHPEGIMAWDELTEEKKDEYDHLMAAYAACVYAMDRAVGELVDGIEARGELDDTLILFMSDNGGCAEGGTYGKMQGDPTTAASNWYCGKAWAWMQDTPFRKYKHYNHEGGIATPLIAHWPNGIEATGEWRRDRAHVIDVMATLVEVTGADYPTEHNGNAIQPMEGVSLVPAFTDETEGRGPMFWEHEGNAAVRDGDWKLVRQGGSGDWELFHLGNDRTEMNNLIEMQPERAAQLERLWLDWASRCNVSPNGKPRDME
jgi:arylsulfatase A-like enzyme